MTLSKKTTHAVEAKDRLLQQLKAKPRLASLFDTFSVQVQDLENMLFDLLENRWIDTAVGSQLDGLGQIVGEPRRGRTDDVYRVAIRVRILINKSSGSPEQLLEIMTLASGFLDLYSVELREYQPAAILILFLIALDCVLDSGTHTGANNASILTDSTKAWSPGVLIGKVVWNVTDDSMAVISANTATTITASLNGGTENDWDTGDVYQILTLPTELHRILHDAKAAGIGAQMVFNLGDDYFAFDLDDRGFDLGRWSGAI